MCGIAGFVDFTPKRSSADLEAVAKKMASAITLRGPDDHGVWTDPDHRIALAHRRLSILDLSPLGHQPMRSNCGRYWIVFNGEIYNFSQIRNELEKQGHRFRGHSDTEVMLASISQKGLRTSLEDFNGMFAFALWDSLEKRLWLARDRMGEKPLYYGWAQESFVFGSELKAIQSFPGFEREIDRNSLASFVRLKYVPAPKSIYKNIFKLMPGCYLEVKEKDRNSQGTPMTYWSARHAVERGLENPLQEDEETVIRQTETLLKEAVALRMVADVPLGAFLSGGVDSSLVVALMQAQSSRPVRTFSIGFEDAKYNEANYAREVARHLGTHHNELYVTGKEALDVIPLLPSMYDEPFADSSQIPTYLVSKLARQHVTVSLSGDGGDELFAGYNRYFYGKKVLSLMSRVPNPVLGVAAGLLRTFSPQGWDRIFRTLGPALPGHLRQSMPGYKLNRLADILQLHSPGAFYFDLISTWKKPNALVKEGVESLTALDQWNQGPAQMSVIDKMMYLDSITYLPDDILAKVDRAAMAVSLESRIPLLDHRVYEFAWRLPMKFKIHEGSGKWILKKVLDQYVPRNLIERPKMGFGVPLESWLRGPLREWTEEFLSKNRLNSEGFFNSAMIIQKWEEHLSGKKDWQFYLWNILMFQSWKQTQHQ